jgi:predicted nucleotidyltransferase
VTDVNEHPVKNVILPTVFHFFPDACAVYLFGSFGTEYERPDSDIDLAILLPPSTGNRSNLEACRAAVEEITGRDVDLIDLGHADAVFRFEIVLTGRLLTPVTSDVRSFEMLTMSLYQKLNEERADILSDIVEKGVVLSR